MKPILLFFPGAGPPGDVAATLGRLFPEVEVVGISYPVWRDLTDPERAMDHVLEGAERQVRAKASRGPVLILGYSLGAQIGWGFAHRLQRAGGTVAFFGAINGRVVATNKPDGSWLRRALRDFASDLLRGDIRAAGAFISSRFSRLLQRAAGGDLPRMAGRWARRGRLPWLLSCDPVFETELSMRLLIRAAVSWTQKIESERRPPLDCPSLLVRGPDDEAFDGRWRSLCPRLDIRAVTGLHVAILEPPYFQEVVGLIRAAAREGGALAMAHAGDGTS
jgi:thioesterase domain-containing protein